MVVVVTVRRRVQLRHTAVGMEGEATGPRLRNNSGSPRSKRRLLCMANRDTRPLLLRHSSSGPRLHSMLGKWEAMVVIDED